MKRSAVVKALADVASKGRYEVNPEGARHMNAVFALAADLINELEAKEAAEDADMADAMVAEESASE